MRIAIVGGGISGSVAAMLLSAIGHRVSLFESRKYTGSDNYSRTGGIIGISYEAMSVLARFDIMPSDYTMGPSKMQWHKVNRRRITESDGMPFGGHNTTWTRLHSILRRATIGLRRIDRLVNVEGSELSFSSGHIARPELTIWADGIRSTGRRLYDPQRKARYAGYVAFRGLPTSEEFAGWNTFHRYWRPGKVLGLIGSDWTLYRNMSSRRFRQLVGNPDSAFFVRELSQVLVDMVNRESAFLPIDLATMLRATSLQRRALLPIVDVDIPSRAVFGTNVLLGDALANVRPHTAMGANLGIVGADILAQNIDSLEVYERRVIERLVPQIKRGQRLGTMSGLGREVTT